mmetsp:Transcript_16381/g.37957  ORF Transcript_16381/g.37957 Transcript_16381/m.37957 type:complete len:221 (+) Transcript_16381:1487-2149(+)
MAPAATDVPAGWTSVMAPPFISARLAFSQLAVFAFLEQPHLFGCVEDLALSHVATDIIFRVLSKRAHVGQRVPLEVAENASSADLDETSDEDNHGNDLEDCHNLPPDCGVRCEDAERGVKHPERENHENANLKLGVLVAPWNSEPEAFDQIDNNQVEKSRHEGGRPSPKEVAVHGLCRRDTVIEDLAPPISFSRASPSCFYPIRERYSLEVENRKRPGKL